MTGAVEATRMLVVWCADWPVVAAGGALDVPAAVVRANRVVACSPAARAEGVILQQRRRDAQARCPGLVVLDDDPAGAARAFEPVAQALGTLTPRLEVVHPGCCALATRGPSRYFGGDLALARRAAALTADVVGPELAALVRVGVADGLFAATLAARHSGVASPGGTAGNVCVVSPGQSAEFLAPLPLAVLGPERTELVDVLRRLGLRSLGDLAAVPVAKLAGRFGSVGLVAQRLARGLDERPSATAPPPPDFRVQAELDPPAERVEAAAFVTRGLADDLHQRLTQQGSACTRLLVGAETEHGERHERLWRTEGTFTPGAIADRLRWQLDGWLHTGAGRPTGGISRLWLAPDEVVPAGGRQLSFGTGGDVAIDDLAAAERAARALARVQGMLGVAAVSVPEWRGGRGPGERVSLVTLGTGDLSQPRPAARPEWVVEPWPGSVPPPAPAVVHPVPLLADLLDAAGRSVRVSGRGELSAAPASLTIRGDPTRSVTAWSRPWPCDERWWDPASHRRRARLQVVADDGVAYLLVLEAARWAIEATYD